MDLFDLSHNGQVSIMELLPCLLENEDNTLLVVRMSFAAAAFVTNSCLDSHEDASHLHGRQLITFKPILNIACGQFFAIFLTISKGVI